jgi:hypothetical protein
MDDERKARINRLKWHCRRALLELDLVFDRFWERIRDSLDEPGEAVLEGCWNWKTTTCGPWSAVGKPPSIRCRRND